MKLSNAALDQIFRTGHTFSRFVDLPVTPDTLRENRSEGSREPSRP
jgi:hypothetical protein